MAHTERHTGSLRSTLRRAAALAIASVALGGAPNALRAQAQPAICDSIECDVSAAERAILVHRLAKYGRANESPLAMLTAAEIALGMQSRALVASASRSDARLASIDDADSLLATAQMLLQNAQAPSDGPLAQMLHALQQRALSHGRGAGGGPRQSHSALRGAGTDSYNVTFRGGEPALVYVNGEGTAPLTVELYDASGKRIMAKAGGDDEQVLRWSPARTTVYRIDIRNTGTAANRYTLITN